MASKQAHDYLKFLAHSLKQWHNQMRTYYLMLESFDLTLYQLHLAQTNYAMIMG